ncbi:MFS transporter [Sphingomonas sp. KR1UV-12]|uniref:MFS transporter n=1 Tax=Sphingomonas aurea TaxID=3063994 RepID=A0ABT9EIE2_9SPHN|nr:MFS transporter [Sphingomonas sp. KR1UV-12]MDP1026730.1 MFS transporter [Sphingomonas sp. KR1UV-12]
MDDADRPAARLATRLAFLIAGFGIACWAPLVPFAKQRLGVDDGALGLLLLCIGMGSVAAMIATGPLSARYGSRPVIVAAGLAMAAILPLLSVAATPVTLGTALLLFGAALGSLDVAMNVHAVEVERAAGQPLMSGFHALFSIGGFAGSTVMTFLLSLGVAARAGTLACGVAMAAAMLIAWPRLLRATAVQDGPVFVRPRGIVLLLAALAAITFLVEGAILDWSALLIEGRGLVARAQGGTGYILFAVAMTAGRLVGDRLTARIGDRATLIGGGAVTVAGFATLLAAPIAGVALAGFLLIGLGASNIVPVLFRRAGTQTAMPPALAIGAITTMGYAGILVGPAAIGVVAQGVGLPTAFWLLALLMCVVPLTATQATR